MRCRAMGRTVAEGLLSLVERDGPRRTSNAERLRARPCKLWRKLLVISSQGPGWAPVEVNWGRGIIPCRVNVSGSRAGEGRSLGGVWLALVKKEGTSARVAGWWASLSRQRRLACANRSAILNR
jgi:hypothetical protein